jgi:hypothetical protein
MPGEKIAAITVRRNRLALQLLPRPASSVCIAFSTADEICCASRVIAALISRMARTDAVHFGIV